MKTLNLTDGAMLSMSTCIKLRNATRRKLCVLSFLSLSLFTWNGYSQETDPTQIFKQVVAAYAAMQTFNTEGTVTTDIGTGVSTETSFTIKLEKPNLYLISWNQKNSGVPFGQAGAAWSDGSQPYLYMGIAKAYSKMTSDLMAISSATGISDGAAFTIPSLFLPGLAKEMKAQYPGLINAHLTGTEQVEGDDCYVINGSSNHSASETYWISKRSYLIRKYARSLEQPKGGIVFPQLTDQQLEQAVKAMGMDVTPANKEAVRKMMAQAASSVKTAKLTGTSTQVYTKMDSPQFTPDDFKFTLPTDAVLKPSLFDMGSHP